MTVQDDERERELCRLFNLVWDPAHKRGGADGYFDVTVGASKYRVEVEVKSSTGDTVSTARDVGLEHIQKWRRKMWLVGFYSKTRGRPELGRSLCLTPHQMEPWIASIEEKIRPDYMLASRASGRLTLDDLKLICGDKAAYLVADAKMLHKAQWTAKQYKNAADVDLGGKKLISPDKMLAILRLRAQYIAERGATLNNPHVTKGHLNQFYATDAEVTADWASRIRDIAKGYIAAGVGYQFPLAPH